nr:MAG TPA: hypothetical protein [Caudoviricetes sp.]
MSIVTTINTDSFGVRKAVYLQIKLSINLWHQGRIKGI